MIYIVCFFLFCAITFFILCSTAKEYPIEEGYIQCSKCNKYFPPNELIFDKNFYCHKCAEQRKKL